MAKFNFQKIIDEYNYELPPELIANNPAHPRDSAKLLVYDRVNKTITSDTFKKLTQYLPPHSIFVFNKTKVIPARIFVYKKTGGKVELFYTRHDNKYFYALSNKHLSPGDVLSLKKFTFEVIGQDEKQYIIKPNFKTETIFSFLEKFGTTPLPPYIKTTTLSENKIKKEYQTVFAEEKGSVAAPTASLHFTKNLMKEIENHGHKLVFITLHVNLGTFAPLTEEHIKLKTLHIEEYEINKKTADLLNSEKEKGKTIIAVGTTVVRTLESATEGDKLKKLKGNTNLFIDKNYKLKFTDSIITNFHVPKSSLLMLVSAFIPKETLFMLYRYAIKNNFRFFSFGDGMFIK